MLAYWRLAVSARAAYFRHAARDAPECQHLYDQQRATNPHAWRACGNVVVGLGPTARPPRTWWAVHDSLVVDLERVARHVTGEEQQVRADEPPTYVAKRNETEWMGETDMLTVGGQRVEGGRNVARL